MVFDAAIHIICLGVVVSFVISLLRIYMTFGALFVNVLNWWRDAPREILEFWMVESMISERII